MSDSQLWDDVDAYFTAQLSPPTTPWRPPCGKATPPGCRR